MPILGRRVGRLVAEVNLAGWKQLLARCLCAALLAFGLESAWPGPVGGEDIAVEVSKDGETVVVDVDFIVRASPELTWAVLTDFDHMADFVSNLTSSSIVSQSGNTFRVAQKGRAVHGPLSFSFDSLREIELTPPTTIRTRIVSGTMRKLDGVTQLSAVSGGTRVVHHAVAIPGVWVPPIVGVRFIEHETREQFEEVRGEILRRRNGATGR